MTGSSQFQDFPGNGASFSGQGNNSSYPSKQESVAWAAGLFEGEGTIYADYKKGRVRIRFSISITDLDVLERFQNAVGCGSISGPYWHKKSTKPCWVWKARKQPDVEKLTGLLTPFLGERRLARLAELQEEYAGQRACRRPGPSRYYVLPGQERL